MKIKIFKKTILIATSLLLCSPNFANITINNFNNKKDISKYSENKITEEEIIQDIHSFKKEIENKDIKIHVKESEKGLEEWIANAGILYKKWLLKEHNAFNGIYNLKINLKEIFNQIIINENNIFGELNFKNINILNNYETMKKINLSDSLKNHPDENIDFFWKTNVNGFLTQKNTTTNQLGGSYKFTNLFSKTTTNKNKYFRHCIGGVDGLHTHDGGWAMAGSHHNYELQKSEYNTDAFINQGINIEIFNKKNIETIIKYFIDWNFPTIKNPNNKSGIWNNEDLIKEKYNSIIKFSENFLFLKEIKEVSKEILELEFLLKENEKLSFFQKKIILEGIYNINNFNFNDIQEVMIYKNNVLTNKNFHF